MFKLCSSVLFPHKSKTIRQPDKKRVLLHGKQSLAC
jgi:hypothetical protein